MARRCRLKFSCAWVLITIRSSLFIVRSIRRLPGRIVRLGGRNVSTVKVRALPLKPNSLPAHKDQNTGNDSKQSQYRADGRYLNANDLQQARQNEPDAQQQHSQVLGQVQFIHLFL